MPKPIVTVLIDTYNHERFIEKAIVSVLEQDFPSDKMEVLVVDDGSTDNTAAIVREFEPRLRLIRKANGGQASAFNIGIPQAQGEIVAFLDGDDWWAPNKLQEVKDVFEKNPGLGAVGHGYYEVNLDTPKNELVVPERTCRFTLNEPAQARLVQAVCDFLGTSKLAVRKEVLDRILPVPENLTFCADAFIFFMTVANAGAVVLDRPLCYYRMHAENLWETRDLSRQGRRIEILERILESVSPGLSRLGIPRATVDALTEPWRLQIERSKLSRDGGTPWRTFQLERTAARLSYVETSFGYKIFKALALGLTLVMPPRRFFQLKQWYSERGLRRYREKVGNVVALPKSIHIRRENVAIESGDKREERLGGPDESLRQCNDHASR